MIRLSEHFDYRKLLRYSFPSIIMLIFTAIYGVVDGFFVSNFVGKTAFTAVNFIMPVLMILGCIGFMFGTGGGALIAKTVGEGGLKKANQIFSMLVYVSFIAGVVLGVLGIIFMRPVAMALGAEGRLLNDSVLYGRVFLVGIPMYILQYEFQCLFATAEKPQLGLYITVAAGLTNMVLDALFVAVFKWGLIGAAAATVLSQCVGGIIPIIYFALPNSSLLKITKPVFDGKALIKICTNGSSELMSNISMSLVSMLYNIELLKCAGENGVAAYGVLMYLNMIFQSAFVGYSVGAAPIISYHFGADNSKELKNLMKRSFIIISIFAIGMFIFSEAMARPLSLLFVGYDKELFEITLRAFFIYSFSYLFSGFSIFSSSFFTALNDGPVSAMISFLRTLVFQVVAVLVFSAVWKLDGIWFSIVFAEVMAVIVSVLFLVCKQKKYKY